MSQILLLTETFFLPRQSINLFKTVTFALVTWTAHLLFYFEYLSVQTFLLLWNTCDFETLHLLKVLSGTCICGGLRGYSDI